MRLRLEPMWVHTSLVTLMNTDTAHAELGELKHHAGQQQRCARVLRINREKI